MRGVLFGDRHTYRDYGLLLKSKPTVSPPVPKYKLVEVTGSSNVIDLTESLTGKVEYEQREIKVECTMMGERCGWDALYSDIMADIHGKRLEITLDDDINHYYTGRVHVGELKPGKKTADLTITATVEPYKRPVYGEGRRL